MSTEQAPYRAVDEDATVNPLPRLTVVGHDWRPFGLDLAPDALQTPQEALMAHKPALPPIAAPEPATALREPINRPLWAGATLATVGVVVLDRWLGGHGHLNLAIIGSLLLVAWLALVLGNDAARRGEPS